MHSYKSCHFGGDQPINGSALPKSLQVPNDYQAPGGSVSARRGEEGAEPEAEAFDLPVDLIPPIFAIFFSENHN